MTDYQALYTEKIEQEIQKMPDEYLPMLLEMIRLFRQSVVLKPADESFRQGWQEAQKGETLPISELWNKLKSAE
ncbi:MAG: hypothetical protein NTZ74_00715 [Chloroflexi bacterium]|nr:hypothetical protein [Chloroflexota bacterium]